MPSELPTLPGIDVAAALSRVNGKRALLWRLIGDFRMRQCDAAARLDAMLAAENWAAARELAHLLKGAAATLGMQRVAAAASALEQSAQQRQIEQTALDELATALAEAGASELPEAAESVATMQSGMRPSDALQRLATALTRNSLSARQDYEQLRAAVDSELRLELTPIGQRIDALDYAEAAKQLARLTPRITAEPFPC